MGREIKVLHHLGFTKDVTNEVVEVLKGKSTKTAAFVVDRIETSIEKSHYVILVSENQFTVFSRWLVTKEEQKQLSQILKLEYVNDGIVTKENGLWLAYIGNEELPETEAAPEEEEITTETAYEAAPYEAKLSIDGELEAEDKELDEVGIDFLTKNVKWTIEKLDMDLEECEDEEQARRMRLEKKRCEAWLNKYEGKIVASYERGPYKVDIIHNPNWKKPYLFTMVDAFTTGSTFWRDTQEELHEILTKKLAYYKVGKGGMKFMIGTEKFTAKTVYQAYQIADKIMIEKGWKEMRLMMYSDYRKKWDVLRLIQFAQVKQ